MKDQSLKTEHQNIFSKIDNILENDVVQFELNPTKEHSIFGMVGDKLSSEAIKLNEMGGPPVMQVFTRAEPRKINPLEEPMPGTNKFK